MDITATVTDNGKYKYIHECPSHLFLLHVRPLARDKVCCINFVTPCQTNKHFTISKFPLVLYSGKPYRDIKSCNEIKRPPQRNALFQNLRYS